MPASMISAGTAQSEREGKQHRDGRDRSMPGSTPTSVPRKQPMKQ